MPAHQKPSPTLKPRTSLIKILFASLLALSTVASAINIAQAKSTKCKIKVVGGSYKGRSFTLRMSGGNFTGQSGVSKSSLEGCRVKKQVFGRWYHLCEKGTLIVYKRKDNKWKRLKPKSLKKYLHTCF